MISQSLWDEWLKYMRAECDVYKLLDSTGKVYIDENVNGNDQSRNRPEIDRRKLRDILLDSLTPGSVKWGKKLRAVESSALGTELFDLSFEDGAIEHGFHLVVGADGAWSKARLPVTQEKPFYCGVTIVETTIHDFKTRQPEMARFVGAGSCMATGNKNTLAAQLQGDGSVLMYAMLRLPETWAQESGIDWESSTTAQQLIDKYFSTWIQELKDFILKGDEPLVVRPLYMLPVGIEWEHKPG
jgi:2-polyprenyl-6-methoxyphenol hydroxylase-like FAD-dependent oxidoreductase